MEMQGKMIEADFERDTITFHMQGEYYARSGTYIILTLDEYRRLQENQLSRDDFISRMRKPAADGQ
jgi:predicted metalloprotease with PDZ domain